MGGGTNSAEIKVNPMAKAVAEALINAQMQQTQSASTYQSWDTEETIIWANSEELPYTFLDILIEKKIDGTSIHIGIQEMQSASERRLAQNAYNILKQKGPERSV